MVAAAGGCALLLAAVLLVAGVRKLLRPRAFAAAIDRLLPDGLPSRRRFALAAAPAVGALELAIGAALLRAPAVPIAAVTLALFLGFGVVVVIAIGGQSGCGCFTAHPDDVATRRDLARTVALGLVAAANLAAALTGRGGAAWSPGAAVVALALGSAIAVSTPAVGTRFRRRAGGSELRPLRGAERAAALRAVEAAPSVLALRARLGPRELDLARALVTAPAGPGWLVVTPPGRRGLRVRMSVPWDGEHAGDAVISAVIDDATLLVSGGVVREVGAARAAR